MKFYYRKTDAQGVYSLEPYLGSPGKYFPGEDEDGYIPSSTVPDQTMTLRELLNRVTRGQAVVGQPDGKFYGEDVDAFDFEHADLADQEAYIDAKAAEFAEIKRRYQQSRKDYAKKQAEEKERSDDDKAAERVKSGQKQVADPPDGKEGKH